MERVEFTPSLLYFYGLPLTQAAWWCNREE